MRTKAAFLETVTIMLPAELHMDIRRYLYDMRSQEAPDEVVARAVEMWLHHARQQVHAPPRDVVRGYQWKSLFLPNGTHLRTRRDGEELYAIVENEHIRCNDSVVSPNQFVNGDASHGRNAWREIHLLMPGHTQWHRADFWRKHRFERELFS
ncbi:MAG: hypothetical protein ACXU8N_14550 [Telluria sp.]